VPCLRITDALARAREIRYEQMLEPGFSEETVRPIEIVIGPGSYVGTFGDNPDRSLEEYPLLINVPRVSVVGGSAALSFLSLGPSRLKIKSLSATPRGQNSH
jgi:hypothetical protein